MPERPLPRCKVCFLPSTEPICSERCRKMREHKAAVDACAPALRQDLASAVRALRVGTTACPGTLGEELLRARGFEVDARDALLLIREQLFAMRTSGALRFFQKGVVVPMGKANFRGPFRIGR